MRNLITDVVTHVRHAPNLRCRDEGEGKYLIYCPKTDEMHIIGEIEKQIFDLCADSSIDSIAEKARSLLDADYSDKESQAYQEILAFVLALIKREILIPQNDQKGSLA